MTPQTDYETLGHKMECEGVATLRGTHTEPQKWYWDDPIWPWKFIGEHRNGDTRYFSTQSAAYAFAGFECQRLREAIGLPAMLDAARAEEREACAKVADSCTVARPNWGTREAIAASIRARGEQQEATPCPK